MDTSGFATDAAGTSVLELTGEIVAAYLRCNRLPPGEVAHLIHQVHASLAGLGRKPEPMSFFAAVGKPKPAVSVKKSVTEEHITCLECGRQLRTLKRHIATNHGKTPAQYREDWKLPASYPLVAPSYALERSRLAKELGLGSPKRKRTARGPRDNQQPIKSGTRSRSRKRADA